MIVVVSGVTLALLAGCGSDNKSAGLPGASTSDRDPCTLLTDEQVGKAIGRAPKAHKTFTETKPVLSCEWTTDSDEVKLHVSVGPAAGYTPPGLDKDPWKKVDGLGEKAAFSETGPVLFVVAGGNGIQILPGAELTEEETGDKDARVAKKKEAAITAAKDVLASLGVGPKSDPKTDKTTRTTKPTSRPETTKTTPSDDTSATETPETPETSETTEPEDTTETSEEPIG